MKINITKDLADHQLMAVSGNIYLNMKNGNFYFLVHTGKFTALVNIENGAIWRSCDPNSDPVEYVFEVAHGKPEDTWKDVTDSVSIQIDKG